jgi:hypothetical protein
MLGTVQVWRRGDGTIELGEAAPMIGVSLGLLNDRAAHEFLTVREGLVTFAGTGPDQEPREVRYRAVGFQAAGIAPAVGDAAMKLPEEERDARLDGELFAALAAAEGGYVLLQRVT